MKQLLKRVFRRFGYEISRIDNIGVDPFTDMARFLPTGERWVIFDVGANVGQSAEKFRTTFPVADIHSFEPSPSVFKILQQEVGSDPRIQTWNCGLGATTSRQRFFENDQSVMSSFLPTGREGWVRTVGETEVEVQTIDSFCTQRQIKNIDVLKSDTQGYDLEVLKGATQIMREGRVKIVYMEVNFADIYVGQGSLGQQYELLTALDFRLFSFYQTFRRDGFAAWTDALFIHRSLVTTQ
jgi:FkbM family methyltransferase